MNDYEEARETLADALEPLSAYVERAHATVDASDPAQEGRLKHITQVEALIDAVADYGAICDPYMATVPNPKAPVVMPSWFLKAQAHLSQPHPLELAALPLETRQAYAAITSYHLQFPDHARTV